MTDLEPPAGPQRPDPSVPGTSGDQELAAERAGVAYWRSVAAQRRLEAARVQHRPIVRAAVALDRRTAGVQDAVSERSRRARSRASRAALVAEGWASRPERRARRAELDRQLDQLPTPAAGPDLEPTTLVVHLGPPPDLDPAGRVEVSAATTLGEVDRVVADATASLVCVLGPRTEPLESTWLTRLTRFVTADANVRAATPLVLQPERRWAEATSDELLVRWSGLEVELAGQAPVPVGRDHGTSPDLTVGPHPVTAATGSAVMMSRQAFLAAGGIGSQPNLDAAVADLCLRHRALGGTVHCVAASVVTDARPVTDRAALQTPLDPTGTAWRALVDDHGPALHAAAQGEPATGGLRIALTTAVPSAKIAPRSGDWHYAGLVAAALERAGHEVHRQTIDQADALVGRACDLHLVLRGLEPVRRTSGQRHILWIISHPEALEIAECDRADLVLVASERFAAHLRTRTSTPVEVLLQATDPDHFHPVPPEAEHRHRVTVVANSRGVLRASVADAVAAGLAPAIYGTGWEGLTDPGLVAAPYAPFDQLPAVYAGAGVVLNDHWETMRHWGFVSNRIFDVIACGTPVLSDDVPEVTELFGGLVPTWRDAAELGAAVEAIEADPVSTASRTAAARELVLSRHTFDHRVRELLHLVELHLRPGATGDAR